MGDEWRIPEDLRPRLEWRPYQARVLAELDRHLADDHLNVVAAPGSGKTILGLEVWRRIGRPGLVLAPTLAIRDQWVERLIGSFLPPGAGRPEWVSLEIGEPAALTVSTYQGLHAAMADGAEPVIARLRAAAIHTLVLDEAHHLRKEWWRHLEEVKRELADVSVVALTATPPYDVEEAEWQRYSLLCGEVDAEIAVPELVAEANLCPHQDFVALTFPSREEREMLSRFRTGCRELMDELVRDRELAGALASHPAVREPESAVEAILEHTEYLAAVAVFLAAATGKPPARLIKVMGLDPGKVPRLDLRFLERLLEGILFLDAEAFAGFPGLVERLRKRVGALGAVERRQIDLRTPERVARALTWSISKMGSIRRIVAVESASLGERLRLVILADHIRADDLPAAPGEAKPAVRIGVAPIFETLRRDAGISARARIGILTGSLTVLPAASRPLLEAAADRLGFAPDDLRTSPLAHDPAYLRLDLAKASDVRMVALMTEVFRRGGVTVLVGTAALLGEGWDAPSVNTLVLASFVGSSMLSNQMRGRAIRRDPDDPGKVATIWHLACVDVGETIGGTYLPAAPGHDFAILRRRFKTFMGVSHREVAIHSGIARMGLDLPFFRADDVRRLNAAMARTAADRPAIREAWEAALATYSGGGAVERLSVTGEVDWSGFLYLDTFGKRVLVAGLVLQGMVGGLLKMVSEGLLAGSGGMVVIPLAVVIFVITLFIVRKELLGGIRALWGKARYGLLAGNLRAVEARHLIWHYPPLDLAAEKSCSR